MVILIIYPRLVIHDWFMLYALAKMLVYKILKFQIKLQKLSQESLHQ